ncbi:hypothetical protein [Micromonospora globbae]|uniref:phage major capsid protein n=1 Tax=Micromonospora globbae TaxID=1894969 RepID=UPI00341C6D5A
MTYPAPAPTLSGNLLTVHRMLTNPAYLRRRLRDFNDMRFVSDQVLTGRYRAEGGAVLYEQSEPFTTDRPVRGVAAGGEYPIANLPQGTAALAAVTKWGQKTQLTFEKVKRSRYPGEEVSKALRTVLNTVIGQVDSVSWAAIASAVTATFDVTAGGGVAWTGASPTILRNILRAKAAITNLKLGFRPDTILMRDDVAAYVMSDDKVTNALRRETRDSPIYSGEMDVIADLAILTSPSAPADPYIFDSTEIGGMADEQEVDPGYAPAEMAIQVKAWIDNDIDGWWLQGRRITVPAVREPQAAVRITNHGVA